MTAYSSDTQPEQLAFQTITSLFRGIAPILGIAFSLLNGSMLDARPEIRPVSHLVINNATYLDLEGENQDAVVNLSVTNGVLDNVSKDPIPQTETTTVLDAEEGYIFGNLTLGTRPSLFILKEDPREDFEVLLDTRVYAVFALNRGIIAKNELRVSDQEVSREIEEEKSKLTRTNWFAYNPPPITLDVGYKTGEKWNNWEGKYISGLFTGALVVDRQYWLKQDEENEMQVGDLTDFEGGEIRGLYAGVVGTVNFETPWIFTLFGATNSMAKGFDSDRDDDFTFVDYRLDIPVRFGNRIALGKQKEPVSMERVTGGAYLPFTEKSARIDSLTISRNIGVTWSGNWFEEDRASWVIGIFNDWLEEGVPIDENDTSITTRITAIPFISDDEHNLIHVGIGYRYSNAKSGARFFAEPEFNNSPVFVDTAENGIGVIEAESLQSLNLELAAQKGPVTLRAEYLINNADSLDYGNLEFTGFTLTGSWAITGEARPYNRTSGTFSAHPVARGAYQGGWGTWELAARYTNLDLTDRPVEGGEMDIYSLGLNWWLQSNFGVQVFFRDIRLNRFGLEGHSQGLTTRLILFLD